MFLEHKGRICSEGSVVRQEQIYLFRDGAMAAIRIKPRCKAFVFYLSDLNIIFLSDLFLCLICFNSFILFLSLSLVSLATYVCDHCYG